MNKGNTNEGCARGKIKRIESFGGAGSKYKEQFKFYEIGDKRAFEALGIIFVRHYYADDLVILSEQSTIGTGGEGRCAGVNSIRKNRFVNKISRKAVTKV